MSHALEEDFSRELLLDICIKCKAVICCRVSPLQKALVVRLIRDGVGAMTLAIGDGANDVSMIQAAHVGVGISGEEGLQAVNSSDYAIAQFRFLKRLILVHGHWCYHRTGTMIINFFYKNWIHTFYLFFFQIYCAWSSTQALDYVYLLLWNSVWAVAAIIGMGIFDQVLPDHVLLAAPGLYEQSRKGSYFSFRLFLIYFVDAIWQASVLFFLILFSYSATTSSDDGYGIALWEWTTTLAIASVLTANIFIGLDVRSWNWFIFGCVWVGPFLIFLFAPIYAAFPPSLIWTYSWSNNHNLYRSALFWLSGILTVTLALLPKFTWRYLSSVYFPNDIERVRQVHKHYPRQSFGDDPAMPTARAANDFSIEDTDGFNQQVRRDEHAMSALHLVASRASSVQHDMLTGQDTPTRGFTFSGEDEPSKGKPKASMSARLLPEPIRRTLENRSAQRKLLMRGDHRDFDNHTGLEYFDNTHRGVDPGPEESGGGEEEVVGRQAVQI